MMTGRLERAVGEMHETDPATGRLVMMLEETCRLHVFSDTKERSAFLKTADKALRSGVSPEFAERTVRLLGIIGGDEAVPILVPFLEDPSDAVRRAAVVACGRQGDVAMVPRLRSVAANGVSHAEGRTVVEALERIGTPEAETVLAEMVRSARSLTAYDAYLALRRLRNIWGPPCSLEEFERARNLSEYGAPACR
jgi:HEAT repeat protein